MNSVQSGIQNYSHVGAGDKVLVALNGGKESLVTAWLLKKQGLKLRGIFFDLKGDESLATLVSEFERKLGIAIQVVNAKADAEAFLKAELSRGILSGLRLNVKDLFHQKFLFPRLYQYKEQYQFQKIATGHRALLQNDSVENVMKVHRYTNVEDDESPMLVGLDQNQLKALIVPLGSIPGSMIDKIAVELQIVDQSEKFDVNWKELLDQARKELVSDQTRTAEVYTLIGNRVGTVADFASVELGDSFSDPEDRTGGNEYTVLEIDPPRRRIIVDLLSKRVIRELQLEDASWFSKADLGLAPLRCAMVWNSNPKAVVVRLLQYEGARMKAFLETPLSGQDANIYNGQSVLWVSGAEVLGGARVTSCKE